MILANFNIYKCDDLNITYNELKKVNKRDGSVAYEWQPSRSYFSNVPACLNAIKDRVVADAVNTYETPEQVLATIKSLQNAIVSFTLKTNEEGEN